jgi:hypothetical protein
MLALCFAAPSVLADEVLYCTDTASTGFKWGKNQAAPPTRGLFNEDRFTIKVISETERIITSNDNPRPTTYECRGLGLLPKPEGPISCVDKDFGVQPWMFYKNNYTRAFLFGPGVDGDPNIEVAYGTCSKF